jgi:carboxypeptidase C (cathepsin A)
MEEYKMRRGEYLEERVPDLEATVEEYFGPITDTEEFNGSDLYVVEEPDNPVFDRIVAGAVSYSSKKDKLAVEFHERDLEELMEADDVDAAGDANDAKNDFLLECTGRDAKSRRESMKRSVEDDAEKPDNV